MMVVDEKYKICQEVYLSTDTDQKKRIVTALIITENDVKYELSCGAECSVHYGFEISSEINVLIT